MSIEEELKRYILNKYKSIRAFTQEIDMPYSTLDTMFKRGIQGASVSNVIKICKVLNIDIDALDEGVVKEKSAIKTIENISSSMSPDHQQLITAYDNADTQHKNIARMALGMECLEDEKEEYLKLAGRNGTKSVYIDKAKAIEALKKDAEKDEPLPKDFV